MRRGNLADQIDVSDVDAELQRRGGDERFQSSVLEPRLRIETFLLRQTAVMRGDGVFAEAVAEVARDAFGHAARVDENQRRFVFDDELREAVVVVLPHLVRHHRLDFAARDFECEIDGAAMAFVDDFYGQIRSKVFRYFLDRLLRRGKPEAQQRLRGDLLQALERDGQVCAAARADDGVDFVDDDGARGAQHLAAALRGQQQVERFGRGDQDVRRLAQHGRALGRGRITGPHRRRDPRRVQPHVLGDPPDAAPRFREVLVNVRAERLQRRNVDDTDFIRQRIGEALDVQLVERGKERRQRFAGAGRRRDEGVTPFANGLPSAQLDGGGRTDRFGKPALEDRVEGGEGHAADHYLRSVAIRIAREGVFEKLSPALGAGKRAWRIFVAAEAATRTYWRYIL